MPYKQARMREDGSLAIPVSFREAMGLKGGDVLTVSMDETGLHVEVVGQSLRRAQEVLSKYGDADDLWSEELIAERRAEVAKEEAENG